MENLNEMKDKICLITGATSGIGYISALELAKKGATVIVCGRDKEKTANAVIQIRSLSNNKNVDFLLADLSNFDEVRNLSKEFINAYPRLDVLINNVGAIFREFSLNRQNIEMTMALNHYSVFLLTGLLLETIKNSAPSRIINVSSMAHKFGNNNFSDYSSGSKYKAFSVYGNSKLAMLHFTNGLLKKLSGTKVTVNAMHPGWVKTAFSKDYQKGFIGMMDKLLRPIQLTPEQGAQTVVYLASSNEVSNISGKYFIKNKISVPSEMATNETVSIELWKKSEQITSFEWTDVNIRKTEVVNNNINQSSNDIAPRDK
jgi:NAD(P)-dependent dehydrogenase (short-subunit alcohol dehydrogenase family)